MQYSLLDGETPSKFSVDAVAELALQVLRQEDDYKSFVDSYYQLWERMKKVIVSGR